MEERIACAFKPLDTCAMYFLKSATILLDLWGKLFVKQEDASDLLSIKIRRGKNERRVTYSRTVVYTHTLYSGLLLMPSQPRMFDLYLLYQFTLCATVCIFLHTVFQAAKVR